MSRGGGDARGGGGGLACESRAPRVTERIRRGTLPGLLTSGLSPRGNRGDWVEEPLQNWFPKVHISWPVKIFHADILPVERTGNPTGFHASKRALQGRPALLCSRGHPPPLRLLQPINLRETDGTVPLPPHPRSAPVRLQRRVERCRSLHPAGGRELEEDHCRNVPRLGDQAGHPGGKKMEWTPGPWEPPCDPISDSRHLLTNQIQR